MKREFFPPKKQNVKVDKVKLPLCLLKQHDMKDYGEAQCVIKNGHTCSDLLGCFQFNDVCDFQYCICLSVLTAHMTYPVHTYSI